MIRRKFILIFFLAAGLLCFERGLSWSDDIRLGAIDKDQNYDIYYGDRVDSGSFIVRNVRILRVDQISGLDFLVFINDSGFNAKSKQGFVLFSTIKAIVPSNTFTIIGGERYKP